MSVQTRMDVEAFTTRNLDIEEVFGLNKWLDDFLPSDHRKRCIWVDNDSSDGYICEIQITGHRDLAALFKLTWC